MSVEETCAKIFSDIDQDGNQTIDLDEFKSYFEQFKDIVLTSGDAEAVFGEIDVNNDGSLTKEELKAYISSRLKN